MASAEDTHSTAPPEASWSARAVAAAIDLLFAAGPVIAAAPLLISLAGAGGASDIYLARALAMYLLCASLLIHLCHALGQQLCGGKTLGRRLLHLQLVADRRWRLMLRTLIAPAFVGVVGLSGLWPLLALWPAAALLSPDGRGPADLIAGTRQLLCTADPESEAGGS